MGTPTNYEVVLAKRPGETSLTTPDCFAKRECAYPELDDDQLIIRTTYISVDPVMRRRLNDVSVVDFIKPYQIGECIEGFGGVGIVEQVGANLQDSFEVGDIVTGVHVGVLWPWKLYWTANTTQVTKARIPSGHDESVLLSCLGLVGLTVLIGYQTSAPIELSLNQTVVVSGAAGACGLMAGQVAHLLGAQRVVGICGSDEKCAMIVDSFGYDAAINYKTQNVSERLLIECPDGVNVYFDNVGGDVSEAVVLQMRPRSSVVLCGQISQYNTDLPYPPPISEQMLRAIDSNNIQRERFLVLRHPQLFEAAHDQLFEWLESDELKTHATILEGLDNAGQAFCDMMNGKNIGKQMVKL